MARVVKEETTLQDRMKELDAEGSLLGRIWKYELYGGGILLAVGIAIGVVEGNWVAAILGAVGVFLGIAHWMKRGETKQSKGLFEKGAEGEAQVARILKTKLPDSYLILNDLSVTSAGRPAQSDHIVLGPNGFFVIETKAYAGTLTGNARSEYLNQRKEFKGKVTETRIKNPIPQNEYHIEILGEVLRAAGIAVDDLHSIIVFTNKWSRIEIPDAGIPVIKPDFLVDTILRHPSKYSYDEAYLRTVIEILAPGTKIP